MVSLFPEVSQSVCEFPLAASCLFSMSSLCALQILLPSVPRRKLLKDGRYSDARQRLYPGCLLVQCVLNREVYNFIRSVPGVWDFFGTRANTRSVYTFIPLCNCLFPFLFDLHNEIGVSFLRKHQNVLVAYCSS
jgi:hypothetical protein